MSVIRGVGRRENDETVERRSNLLDPLCHRTVPQFQVTSPFILPIRIQVEKGVDPSVQVESGVRIEVGMDLQESVPIDHV